MSCLGDDSGAITIRFAGFYWNLMVGLSLFFKSKQVFRLSNGLYGFFQLFNRVSKFEYIKLIIIDI